MFNRIRSASFSGTYNCYWRAVCTALLYEMGIDARKKMSLGVREQHRHRPASASAQSDQRLCYSLIVKYHI